MNPTARNLAILGGVLDIITAFWFGILLKDVAADGQELTPTTTLLAIGLATLAAIGAAMLLTAAIIGVIESIIDRRTLSYADGVLHGVREAIDASVGRLVEALPDYGRTVRPLRPRHDRGFRH